MSLYTSDSSSKYSQSADIYQVGAPTNFKAQSVKSSNTRIKDTIEISKDSLKNDALHRLKNPSKSVIMQPGFIRIGKYFFMGLAFPPYFLLYGLPKWVIIEALPQIFNFMLLFAQIAHNKMKKPWAIFKSKMSQFVEFSKRITFLLIEPIARVVTSIQLTILKAYQTLSRQFTTIRLKFLKPFLQIKHLLDHFSVKKFLQNAKKSILTNFQFLSHSLSQTLQTILNFPLKLIENTKTFQIPVPFQTLFANVKQGFNQSQKLAQNTTQWIKNQFKSVGALIGLVLQSFKKIQQKFLSPVWVKVKVQLVLARKKFNDFFQKKHQKYLENLALIQSKIKNFSINQSIDKWINHSYVTSLPQKIQQFLKLLLQNKMTLFVFEQTSKLFRNCSIATVKAIESALKGSGSAINQLSKNSSQVGTFFKNLTNSSIQGISKLTNKTGIVLEKSLYYFLLTLMIGAILSSWGIISLKEMMDYLKSKISLKN